MKKIVRAMAAVLCVSGITLSLCACGEQQKPEEGGGQQIETPVKPVRKNYALFSDGHTVISGTAANSEGKLTLDNAVIQLNKPIVLPLGEKSDWNIEFKATLMPDGAGGGQFLNSLAFSSDGRIYFGVNGQNNVLFMGVCIGDTYANYCWDVPLETMRQEHEYKVKFDGKEFILNIDGGENLHFESININQSNRTPADGEKASKELKEKICAVTGQEYVAMAYMGSETHPCTDVFVNLTADTSSIRGYEDFYVHPLFGKTIYCLGSSVTRGHGGNTDGTSFADLAKRLTGAEFKKEAISGTNLAIVNGRTDSYAERLSRFNLQNLPDALIVQLSTNDFVNNVPAGSVSQNASYDKGTLTGALEYIISTVTAASPDTKIIVYTCPLGTAWSKYTEYGDYVNGTLKALADKWQNNLHVLDLYNADYIKVPSYMQSDNLHPQKEGYAQVFTPKILKLLSDILL